MATFSNNQVRQFYVVNAYKATAVNESDAVGTISVHGNAEDLYFLYKGAGGVTRTDLIKKGNVLYAKATPAAKMARKLKNQTVSLDSGVNSGTPIAGQDYLLRVAFQQYIGLSNEDQYFKYGVVRATSGMTADGFYKAMIDSLEKNFSREITPLLSFTLDGAKATADMTTNSDVTLTAVNPGVDGNAITLAITSVTAGATAVTVSGTDISVALAVADADIGGLKDAIAANEEAAALVTVTGTDATAVSVEATPVELAGGTSTGILVSEVEQPWVLGKFESVGLNFKLLPATVEDDGLEVIWGTVKDETATELGNGKVIADMEHFYMGDRADLYRGMGFPNDIKTTYLVDADKVYNTVDLHYFYSGANEAVQKSEKDITLVFPSEGVNLAAQVALANNVIGDINTEHGTTLIATLPTT